MSKPTDGSDHLIITAGLIKYCVTTSNSRQEFNSSSFSCRRTGTSTQRGAGFPEKLALLMKC